MQNAYRAFLEAVSTQLGGTHSNPKAGVILVDLSHDWIEYLLHSLLIAKRIQIETHAEIVGVCIETSVVARSCPNFDPNKIADLAAAFGLSKLVVVPANELNAQFARHVTAQMTTISNLARESSLGIDIRELLSNEANFLTCAYESALRSRLIPTAPFFDPNLLMALVEVSAADETVRSLFENNVVRGLVVGHLDYNPWRLLCHHAASRSVPIYYFFSGSSLSIWRLMPQNNEPFGAAKSRATAETFAAYRDTMDGDWAYRNTSLLVPTKGEANFSFAFMTPNGRRLAREHLERAGDREDGRLVISLFAHTFSDIPRSDQQLFADHADWMEQTLAFAAETTDRTWIVRAHPLDRHYDQTGFLDGLKDRYASREHIHFMASDENLNAVLCRSDMVVTVRGTVGVEAIAAGVPCILAGEGPYSRLGFVSAPSSREAYFELLGAKDVSPVSPDAVEQARNFLRFEATIADVQSNSMLPSGSGHVADDAYFSAATKKLARYAEFSDPLAAALHPLINGTVHEGRAVTPLLPMPRQSKNARSMDLKAPLYFAKGRFGTRALVAGFHEPEEQGIWQSRTRCALILPWPVSSIKRLKFVGRTLVSNQKIFIRTQSGMPLPLELPWDNGNLVRAELAVESRLDGDDDCTLLELEVNEIHSPASLGMNDDRRELGFYLNSIGVVDA